MSLNGQQKNLLPEEFSIVDSLRQYGQLTRNELVERVGLSRSKVTQLINKLIDDRILKDTQIGESSGGRRPGLVDLNGDYGYVVGIHMGATGASIALSDFRGKIITWRRQPLHIRDTPNTVMDTVFQHVQEIVDQHQIKKEHIFAFGIGVPAPVDHITGSIISPATMIGWDNFSIVDYCRQKFPHSIIKVDNDVSLMALGEARMGAGRNHQNFFFVKVGTGIGCGIVCNGEIYRGTGDGAGHIGHVSIDRNGPVCHCGNIGCLEKFAAGPAIAEQAMQAVHANRSPILASLMNNRGGYLIAEDVGAAAARGDKVANDIIIDSGRIIGEILATLVSFFNPSLVIIGGGVSNIGPQFLVSIHRTILEYSLPLSTHHLSFQKSEMGHHAGIEGTITMALSHIFIQSYNKA